MTTFSFKTIGAPLNQAETAAMRVWWRRRRPHREFGEPCDNLASSTAKSSASPGQKNTRRPGARRAGVPPGSPGGGGRLPGRIGRPPAAYRCRRALCDRPTTGRRPAVAGVGGGRGCRNATPRSPTRLTLAHRRAGARAGWLRFSLRLLYCAFYTGALCSRPLPGDRNSIRCLEDGGYQDRGRSRANLGCYAWQAGVCVTRWRTS